MNTEKITLRDIYDVVNRLEDKVDKRITTVESEIKEMKSFQNRVMGVASVMAAFVSLLATFIWNRITGQHT
jgi:hypothetical protein